MAAQRPMPPASQNDPDASGGQRFVAVLLWGMTVVLGGAGAALAYGLSWTAAGLWQAVLGSAVAGLFFGVLIAGAVLATMQDRGRQTSGVLVFAASLVVGAVVFGFVGYLGQRSAEQDASDACSGEARDVLAQLSFYADLDQSPTGTQYGSCYIVYTMGETGPQASDAVQQLLAENGWPLECDPVFRDDGGYRCRSGWQDGLMLEVYWEGSHELPGDDLAVTEDGATTVAIDVVTWDPRMGPMSP